VVSILDISGKEIGRGLSNYTSEGLLKIKGKKLPEEGAPEAMHRDNIVIL
jgi:glutamate 5-kinase